MGSIWKNLSGALRRVFPAAMTDAQSIAFSMFLAFFPILLLALGLLTFSPRMSTAALEFFSDAVSVLPPESRHMVNDFLTQQGTGGAPHVWILLGLGGTLFCGSQVMSGFMQAFRHLYCDATSPGYWRGQARAFLLLVATIGPMLGAIVLTVFGRQFRNWLIFHFDLPVFFNSVWVIVYVDLALVFAMLVLTALYHTGRSSAGSWNDVFPGAVVATLLWCVVNAAFGIYVRQVPYSAVYGGLAAVIGLLVWMNLCVLIVLLGAAYNAEALSRRQESSMIQATLRR